jgi:hypothetical protein
MESQQQLLDDFELTPIIAVDLGDDLPTAAMLNS